MPPHTARPNLLIRQLRARPRLILAIALGLLVWLSQTTDRLPATGLALVIGGAIGNVIDRLVHGYVVDFLDFHWAFLSGIFPGGHFPAFNVADVAISVGAAGLILDELLRVRRAR